MRLISDISSIVLLLYVFACVVDAIQMRRDKQLKQAAVLVGFIGFAQLIVSLAALLIQIRPELEAASQPLGWISVTIPVAGLAVTFFVKSEPARAVLIAYSVAAAALALVLAPFALLRVQLSGVQIWSVVIWLVIPIGAIVLARMPSFLVGLRFWAAFVATRYILGTILGHIAIKLSPPVTGFESLARQSVLSTSSNVIAIGAAWFIAQAIAKRLEPQTSSVTSEA